MGTRFNALSLTLPNPCRSLVLIRVLHRELALRRLRLRHLRRAQGDRDRGGSEMDWVEGGGLVNPASPQNAGMGGIPNGRGLGNGGGGSASRRVSRIPPELDNTGSGMNEHHPYLSPHHLSAQHLSSSCCVGLWTTITRTSDTTTDFSIVSTHPQ
jgi:hypothetical protein